MRERGKIVKVKKESVLVQLEPQPKCHGCSMESFCYLGDDEKRYVEVEKTSQVKVGDKVEVEIKAGYFLKGTFFLFIIPAVAFIAGVAIGQMFFEKISFSLLAGIAFLFASFFLLHLLDKKLASGKGKSRIVAIFPG
ncbi:SoxR reducing system RseC family protein [Candidatus Aerophobetes bacterium]|nr:SoxR reducing system RseC family protein [Candidatus Aerophobetes bacterium]